MADVDIRHPCYAEFAPLWLIMRDTVAGEERIKQRGAEYLPMPGGMCELADAKTAYANYQGRAQFPEIAAPAVRGLSGVIHANHFTIELPQALNPIRERATGSGLDLDGLHRRITRELLEIGRYGLHVYPSRQPGRDAPFMATYTAESIINWEEGANGTIFVLLDETDKVRNPDSWQWETVEKYRELTLENGILVVRVYERTESAALVKIDEDALPIARGGKRIDFMPFTFIDTNDLTPEPDEVPLIGIARKALAIYRKSADYEQALYMTSQPTPVISGLEKESDEQPTTIGSSKPWIFSSPDTKAMFLEYTGPGIANQRQAMLDDAEHAAQLGARMFGSEGRQAESGDALRLRRATETATLNSIAKTSAAGLQSALRHAARWVGANPEEVVVKPPEKLVAETLTPQEIDSIVRGWQANAYPWSTVFENLQRGGIIDREANPETMRDEIDQEEPLGLMNDDGRDHIE